MIAYTRVHAPATGAGFHWRVSVRGTILGIIFALFVVCFVAIIIEETLLGGRRVRRMKKALKEKRNADNTNR